MPAAKASMPIGLAMDIAGFELTDGTMISVKEDWAARPGRDFLRAVATEPAAISTRY